MTDIIDRLKEPEVHYPGNFDTPKRANAMLSCLCQEAAEEIESLRRQLKHMTDQYNAALEAEQVRYRQLAASQAREQQLREALNQGYGWAPIGSTSKQITGRAIALPQDTTALSAMIAKAGEVMRERCAVLAAWQADGLAAAVEIRAIPAVTLDELKGGA